MAAAFGLVRIFTSDYLRLKKSAGLSHYSEAAALELETFAIRDAVMRRLRALPPNPLHDVPTVEAPLDVFQELDLRNDNSEE